MSFNEWKSIKLGDIVDISSSKRIFAKEYVSEGIPFYRGKEIIEKSKGDKVSNKLFISRDRYTEIKDKFGVPKTGDILLTSVGTLGIPYLVQEEKFYFKDGNLTWFKNFSSKCDNKFIYFWLQSIFCKNQIYAKAIGSTQKALTIEILKNFDVLLPPLKEQKAIADILSSLDDKIELNNQMNKTLDEMAQTLFKRWFVDFEFPNEEGQPYKSSGGEMIESELGMIPKEWDVRKILDVSEQIGSGGTPLRKKQEYYGNDVLWLKTKELEDTFIFDTEEKITELGLKESSAKLYPKNTILIAMYGATVGKLGIISKQLSFNQATCGMVANEKILSHEYLFQWLKYNRASLINLATGSAQQNLSVNVIKNTKLLCPNQNTIDSYTNILRPIFNYQEKIQYDNSVLKEIRDTLLAKLMSGEIRVSDLC